MIAKQILPVTQLEMQLDSLIELLQLVAGVTRTERCRLVPQAPVANLQRSQNFIFSWNTNNSLPGLVGHNYIIVS